MYRMPLLTLLLCAALLITPASAHAIDTTPPTAPVLTQPSRTATSFSISWMAASDDVAVTGYEIRRDGALWQPYPGGYFGYSYEDTDSPYGSTHVYTVVALDAAGNRSPESNAISTADTVAPGTPTNLRIYRRTSTSVELLWNSTTDNVAVKGYRLLRDGVVIADYALGCTCGLSYDDTASPYGSSHVYTAIAYDHWGNVSAPSNAINTADTIAPAPVTTLRLYRRTDSNVELMWNGVTDNLAVKGYHLLRNGVVIATYINPSGCTAGCGWSYRDWDARYGITNVYSVIAFDHWNNQSAPGNEITTADTTPPTVPANLRFDQRTSTSVQVRWNSATDDVAVKGYRLLRDGALIADYPATCTSCGFDYVDTGSPYGSTHTYAVQAYDHWGNTSTPSASISTADTQAPTAPANLAVAARTNTSAKLTWTAATDNIAVREYVVYRNGVARATVATTSYTDTNAKGRNKWTYRVAARDWWGNLSPLSSAVLT